MDNRDDIREFLISRRERLTPAEAALPDFGDDEWPGMICVETANAADSAVTLAPGQTHRMSAGIGLA